MILKKGDLVAIRHDLDLIIYTVESLYDERWQSETEVGTISVAALSCEKNGISVGSVEPISRLMRPNVAHFNRQKFAAEDDQK